MVQIAGLIARRIVCYVREGAAGWRRRAFRHDPLRLAIDAYMPEGTAPLVAVGQTSLAGETVLADLRATDEGRAFRAGLTTAEFSRRGNPCRWRLMPCH